MAKKKKSNKDSVVLTHAQYKTETQFKRIQNAEWYSNGDKSFQIHLYANGDSNRLEVYDKKEKTWLSKNVMISGTVTSVKSVIPFLANVLNENPSNKHKQGVALIQHVNATITVPYPEPFTDAEIVETINKRKFPNEKQAQTLEQVTTIGNARYVLLDESEEQPVFLQVPSSQVGELENLQLEWQNKPLYNAMRANIADLQMLSYHLIATDEKLKGEQKSTHILLFASTAEGILLSWHDKEKEHVSSRILSKSSTAVNLLEEIRNYQLNLPEGEKIHMIVLPQTAKDVSQFVQAFKAIQDSTEQISISLYESHSEITNHWTSLLGQNGTPTYVQSFVYFFNVLAEKLEISKQESKAYDIYKKVITYNDFLNGYKPVLTKSDVILKHVMRSAAGLAILSAVGYLAYVGKYGLSSTQETYWKVKISDIPKAKEEYQIVKKDSDKLEKLNQYLLYRGGTKDLQIFQNAICPKDADIKLTSAKYSLGLNVANATEMERTIILTGISDAKGHGAMQSLQAEPQKLEDLTNYLMELNYRFAIYKKRSDGRTDEEVKKEITDKYYNQFKKNPKALEMLRDLKIKGREWVVQYTNNLDESKVSTGLESYQFTLTLTQKINESDTFKLSN